MVGISARKTEVIIGNTRHHVLFICELFLNDRSQDGVSQWGHPVSGAVYTRRYLLPSGVIVPRLAPHAPQLPPVPLSPEYAQVNCASPNVDVKHYKDVKHNVMPGV